MDVCILLICLFVYFCHGFMKQKEKKLDEFPMITLFHQRQRTMPIFIKAPEHIPYNTIQYRTYCTPEEKRSKYIELVKKDEEMQTFLNQFEATKKEGWYCENNTITYILYYTKPSSLVNMYLWWHSSLWKRKCVFVVQVIPYHTIQSLIASVHLRATLWSC